MTFEDNWDKKSMVKSKQNGNLGSDETNTVSIKNDTHQVPNTHQQACEFAELIIVISKITVSVRSKQHGHFFSYVVAS